MMITTIIMIITGQPVLEGLILSTGILIILHCITVFTIILIIQVIIPGTGFPIPIIHILHGTVTVITQAWPGTLDGMIPGSAGHIMVTILTGTITTHIHTGATMGIITEVITVDITEVPMVAVTVGIHRPITIPGREDLLLQPPDAGQEPQLEVQPYL